MPTQRDNEVQLVTEAQKRGMTPEQTKEAVLKYRSQFNEAPQPEAQPQAPAPAPHRGIMDIASDVVVGAGKGIGSTISGLESLGEKFITRPIDKAVSFITGKKGPLPTEGPTEGEQIQEKYLQPTNTAQKVGKGVEQFAELLTPTGLEAKGASLVGKIAPKAPKLAQEALALAGKGIGGALEFGGKTAIQTGGNAEETKRAAILGGMFPAGEALLGNVAKGVGKAGMEILGKSTGAGEAALREAYNNPNVIKFARQAGGRGGVEALQEQALAEAKSGLVKIKEARGKAYETALGKVKAIKKEIDPIVTSARQKATEMLAEAGIKTRPGKLLNNLDFGASVIEKGQGSVQKAVNDVMKWTENTPAGLDKLKKKLASHLKEVKDAPGAYQIIKGLRDTVREGLETGVKGYKEMTHGYHTASNIIDDLEKTLSLGDKARKETALNKIMNALRQDKGLRQDMLRSLGTAGGNDVIGKIAGAQLAPLSARGLAGVAEGFIGPGGIVASLLNPSHIPALLAYLAGSSPRLVAEAVSLLGKSKGRMLTPEIKKALEAIILQAMKEDQKEDLP